MRDNEISLNSIKAINLFIRVLIGGVVVSVVAFHFGVSIESAQKTLFFLILSIPVLRTLQFLVHYLKNKEFGMVSVLLFLLLLLGLGLNLK